jgi:hypothetical protein
LKSCVFLFIGIFEKDFRKEYRNITIKKRVDRGENMILETERTVALKNNNGGYDISGISVFKEGGLNVSYTITLSKSKTGRSVTMKARCPLCGAVHSYRYSLHEFCLRTLIVGGCEFTGLPLFYLGEKARVQEKISRTSKIEKKICAYTQG